MNYTWAINTYKNLSYLKLAIDSIRRNAFDKTADIVVYVENDQETAEWLSQQMDILPVIEYNDVPKGIGGGVNKIIEQIKTPYFSLIHSDMYISKDYDKGLIECYQHTKLDHGVPYFVSATRIEPNIFGPYQTSRPGTIVVPKEAFGEFHHNFDMTGFTGWAEEFVKINSESLHRKLEGVSYFGKVEDFLKTGGNDPLYAPASFEDHDLTIRMMCMGYEFVTTNQAVVYHFGARGSIFRDDNLSIRHPRQIKAEADNKEKWMKKWGEMFTEDEVGFIKLTPTLRKRYSEIYKNC
jgi:GT2 family glycosyltransferase